MAFFQQYPLATTTSINGVSGDLTLVGGVGIDVDTLGQTITISATGPAEVSDLVGSDSVVSITATTAGNSTFFGNIQDGSNEDVFLVNDRVLANNFSDARIDFATTLKFFDGSSAPTVGDVWTATNIDGSGEWTAIPDLTLVPVDKGGTGITSGTSGGILGFTASGIIASSALLAASQVVIGGGAGATPTTLSAGSQYQSLVMGAATPAWSAVNLAQAAAITGILPVANGGTGLASGSSGGVLGYTAAGVLASSGALTANQLIVGGGAGATPATLAAGSQYQVLRMGATTPAYGSLDLSQSAAVTGVLPNANTTAASANTASAIVARDGSGNFTAGTITAALAGNASTVTTNANLTGDVTSVGNATTIGALKVVNSMIANTTIDLTAKVTGVLPNANTTATAANTASTIVLRDGSGDFAANAITAVGQVNALNIPSVNGPSTLRRQYVLNEDWTATSIAGASGWSTMLATGTVAVTNLLLDATHQGIVLVNSGAANANAAAIYLGSTGGTGFRFVPGTATFYLEALIQLEALSTGANDYTYRFGFVDNWAGEPNNGCYFQYVSGTSTNWACRNAVGGLRSTVNTVNTAVAATAWIKLAIKMTATTSEFFINDVSQGVASSTRFPANAPGWILMGMQKNTNGATSRYCALDYVSLYIDWPSSR